MSTLSIFLAIALIIFLSLRGLSILITAPIATLVVIIFNKLSIFETLLGNASGTYMGALGSYTMNYFAMFLLGAILAKLMEESVATVSISEYILKRIGTDNPYRVPVTIFVISSILTYGGISVFVVMFAILPMVPHGGAIITFLSISGLNYKNGLKEGFITVTVSSIIALLIVIATGFIF